MRLSNEDELFSSANVLGWSGVEVDGADEFVFGVGGLDTLLTLAWNKNYKRLRFLSIDLFVFCHI